MSNDKLIEALYECSAVNLVKLANIVSPYKYGSNDKESDLVYSIISNVNIVEGGYCTQFCLNWLSK